MTDQPRPTVDDVAAAARQAAQWMDAAEQHHAKHLHYRLSDLSAALGAGDKRDTAIRMATGWAAVAQAIAAACPVEVEHTDHADRTRP